VGESSLEPQKGVCQGTNLREGSSSAAHTSPTATSDSQKSGHVGNAMGYLRRKQRFRLAQEAAHIRSTTRVFVTTGSSRIAGIFSIFFQPHPTGDPAKAFGKHRPSPPCADSQFSCGTSLCRTWYGRPTNPREAFASVFGCA